MKIEVTAILEEIKELRKDGAYIRNTKDSAIVYYPNKGLVLTISKGDLEHIYDIFTSDTELIKHNFYDFAMYVYLKKALNVN